MSMTLTAFLAENADQIENEKYVVSPRFRGEDGQPIPWDFNQYLGKLAAACTVYPNLNDTVLQDSYRVMGADNLLKAMLSAGEFAAFVEKLQQICGFDSSLQDQVDEAKN